LHVTHRVGHRGRIARLHGRPQVRRTDPGRVERGLERPLDDRTDIVGRGVERILALGLSRLQAVDRIERRYVLRRSGLSHGRGIEGEQLVQIGLDLDGIAEQGACRRLDATARGQGDDQQRHGDEREFSATLHRDEGYWRRARHDIIRCA